MERVLNTTGITTKGMYGISYIANYEYIAINQY